MSTIEDTLEHADRLRLLVAGSLPNVRTEFAHTHMASLSNPEFLDLVMPRDCTRCRRERRLRNARVALEPYDSDWGTALESPSPWPDFADVVRLAWCDEHGLEAVTGERHYRTGYDRGIAGEFACGAIVTDDVF